MSNFGRDKPRPRHSDVVESPQLDDPRPGATIRADREWAQHRIGSFFAAQRVHRKAVDGEGQGKEQQVSQPGEPAEAEADHVADQVADSLHGGPKPPGANVNQKAAPIAAKLDGSVIHRMPKWKGGDDEEGRGEKGKTFRGGKKKDRDNWYGFDDPEFQKWWHRIGKQEIGGGKDIDNRQQAEKAYNYWVSHNRPRGDK
jgi:hypothetical protein